jgi:quercetin dioxygenase-like cupin family protein
MQLDEFRKLVALYALDILSESERHIVEDAIAHFPELQTQLIEFQQAISTIPYSAPPVAMAADLKARLFDRIATQECDRQTNSIAALRKLIAEVSWEPYSMAGVDVAKLFVNDEKRKIAYFVRAEAGVKFPNHRHAGDEEIIVIEGDLTVDEKTYGSGDRIYSCAGSAHQPETAGGCTLFLKTSLDDEIIE